MHLAKEAPAAYLENGLEELRGLHERGGGGYELARGRADLLDLVLISLFREAERRVLAGGRFRQSGLAVVALGGYGRRELAPYSDVDLMLLYDTEDGDVVQEMAERLFYPLWDAGLELGHGARTVEECLAVAAGSLEDHTSFLQSRYVVGSNELYRAFTDRLSDQATADGGRSLVEGLLAGREDRHERYGASAALLEPHLKEGRGGLRDVQELLWAGMALHGGAGVESLAMAGWLSSEDVGRLEEALEVLLYARTSLHYAAGRKVDRLYLDYQEDVAADWRGRPRTDVAARMAGITDASHAVALLTSDAWEALLQETGISSRRRRASLPVDLPANSAGRRSLLMELLHEGYDGLPRLERLSHAGHLSEWLPGWGDIRYLGQRDGLHTYTVDGHAFHCVAVAVELATKTGPDRTGSLLAADLALTPRWEAFLLGCLLHDLGKGIGSEDHSRAGADLVREAARALDMSVADRDLVAFLAREHLLLIDTATRRDLEDERLLERLAATITTRERLEMLYVLTVADCMSTGSASWTPWIATLVQDLLFKLLPLVEEGRVAHEESESLAASERTTAERGRGWLLYSETVVCGNPVGEVAVEVRQGAVERIQELTVVSPAQTGFLTRLSGVLSHHDVNIMSAQVQPAGKGLVARGFQVGDQFGHGISGERWERLCRDLGLVLEGRLALEYRLARKAAAAVTRRSGPLHETRVVVDNSASEELTVVEVHAHDRIGLLHTLTGALDDLLLEVRLAKISTVKDRAVDVFYVADAYGRKVVDSDHVTELKHALAYAVDERT